MAAAPAVHPASTATIVSNSIGAPRKRVNVARITTVHPARRQRREIHGAAAVTTAAKIARPTAERDPIGGEQCVRPVHIGDRRFDEVDDRADQQGEQHRDPGGRGRDRQEEPPTAEHGHHCPAHDHHHTEDLSEQDQPGDQPRRQGIDTAGQIGDEADDGLVEERSDDDDASSEMRRPPAAGRRSAPWSRGSARTR